MKAYIYLLSFLLVAGLHGFFKSLLHVYEIINHRFELNFLSGFHFVITILGFVSAYLIYRLLKNKRRHTKRDSFNDADERGKFNRLN